MDEICECGSRTPQECLSDCECYDPAFDGLCECGAYSWHECYKRCKCNTPQLRLVVNNEIR